MGALNGVVFANRFGERRPNLVEKRETVLGRQQRADIGEILETTRHDRHCRVARRRGWLDDWRYGWFGDGGRRVWRARRRSRAKPHHGPRGVVIDVDAGLVPLEHAEHQITGQRCCLSDRQGRVRLSFSPA
jgi:hypothetical protein